MSSSTDVTIFETFDIVRLFRLRFEEAIAASDVIVTPAEARILLNLSNHGPSRQGEIADRLAIGAMSVTGLIDRLERAGFVRRETDPTDRRANRVYLTEESVPVLSRIDKVKALLRERARQSVDPDDYAIYAGVVHQMRANLLCSDAAKAAALETGGKERTDA